jgi:hypothetical protein
MKEALGSSETSVITRATRPNIPEGTILQRHTRFQSDRRLDIQEDTVLLFSRNDPNWQRKFPISKSELLFEE